MNYLSRDLIDMILTASVGTLVLLQAQTGSGKSTMITSNLWAKALMDSKPLLWVLNRTALKNQAVADVLSQQGVDTYNIDFSIDGYIAINGLVIMSYQYLSKRLESAYNGTKIGPYTASSYRYVIFDEAHFFIADSRFNAMTGFFKKIPSVFTGSIHIYMSATLRPVKKLIFKLEGACLIEEVYAYPDFHPFKYVDLRNPALNREHRWIERKVLELEAAKPDYSYLDVRLIPDSPFEQLSIITNLILKCPQMKIIWFINKIEAGKKISERLTKLNISNALIFSSPDNKHLNETAIETLNEIQNHSRFSVQVLLTTDVLDNGVNIKDPSVTHILTSGTEEISIIQQIGRVRMQSSEDHLTVLLPDRGKNFFSSSANKAKHLLWSFNKFEKTGDTNKRLVEMANSGVLQDIMNCLYITDLTHEYRLNPLAYDAYHYYAKEYENTLSLMKSDEHAWIKKVLSWLNKSYDPLEEEDLRRKNELRSKFTDFLDSIGSDVLSDEAYATCRRDISDYIRQVEGVDLTHGHKNKRLPGASKINDYISQYGYKFTPDGHGHHMLCKISDRPM